MKYLIWKKRLQTYIETKYESHADWETWCDWKEYFWQGCSPQDAVEKAHKASQ